MLKKKYIKSRKINKISFVLPEAELPGGIETESVFLVGEFNEWDPTASSMKQNSKGSWVVTLELEPGIDYEYRYLVNGEHWCNDWHADTYIPNDIGSENCVVVSPSFEG